MLTADDLRCVLLSLATISDEAQSREGYNVPYQCGYASVVIHLGWHFGLRFHCGHEGLGRSRSWEHAPDPGVDLSAPLAAELRRQAVKNLPEPGDCPEDLDCQRGCAAALGAAAEKCNLSPEGIGLMADAAQIGRAHV